MTNSDSFSQAQKDFLFKVELALKKMKAIFAREGLELYIGVRPMKPSPGPSAPITEVGKVIPLMRGKLKVVK